MGAHRAEKFTDYYVVLGVDPKADSETVSTAYQTLARKYHPDNALTGNAEKFAQVNEAYEILANPSSRAAFDGFRASNVADSTPPSFSGRVFFEALRNQNGRRIAILSVLYDRRRLKPFTPSLSLRQLENIVEIPNEDLTFAIWYLKQRGWIVSDDKSSLQISVEGMDQLERTLPDYQDVEPFLKQKEEQPKPEPATENLTQLSARIRSRAARNT